MTVKELKKKWNFQGLPGYYLEDDIEAARQELIRDCISAGIIGVVNFRNRKIWSLQEIDLANLGNVVNDLYEEFQLI